MAKDVFDSSTAIEMRDALNGVLLNSSRFNWKLYEAFAEAYSVYLNILFREGNTSKDLAELKKIIRKKIGNIFNTKFRDDNFIATLLNVVASYATYPHFFEQPHGLESAMEFFATETWLYDSPPVIGEIYREFVKYCYQQNLFIRNKMMVDGVLVSLKDINMPFLNVLAQRDDLVASRSSIALNNAVGSVDKSAIEFQSGHVGLIIGQRAHQEVWPKVGDWLRERS
jgi:poly(3-hydroxyalkanoate) synthetase